MKLIKLPFTVKKPILACGADLKGSFGLAHGDEAFLFEGFGDLGGLDNFTRYGKSVKDNVRRLKIKPEIIACDLHSGYFSTKFAESFQLSVFGRQLCKIQHHEAHVASAMVDNTIRGDVIGVAFDGTGYGSDGKIWGGEFFVGGLRKISRVAHLEYISMPGGEKAIIEPWRMAASYLYHAFGNNLPPLVKRWNKKEIVILKAMIDKNINSPLTSSAGRLFDAVGSLVLRKDSVSKEAELPIEMERLAIELCRDKYDFDIGTGNGQLSISCKKIVRGVVKDIVKKVDTSTISSKFHNTVAEIILQVSLKLRKKFDISRVILSGGVFQNNYLRTRAVEILKANGMKVYTHSGISTNDSGIPIGQIAIANMRLRCV